MFLDRSIILATVMESFSVLNSRKRAIIALVHSLFFLAVAGIQAAISHAQPLSFHGATPTGGLALLAIYVIVTSVLLLLLVASHCAKEKLYFALCAGSAGFGLLRIVLGDPALHANVLRVVFLTCAVLVGVIILRSHSQQHQLRTEYSAS
jgi:hypothetical protein